MFLVAADPVEAFRDRCIKAPLARVCDQTLELGAL